MKRLLIPSVALLLLSLFFDAQAQDRQQKDLDPKKHVQMMEMMKDKAMMETMMDHMASDKNMRMAMMQKMMQHAKKDSSSMMEMCKKMMDDQDMHSMMMKMMGGGMIKKEADKTSEKKESHKDHH